MAIAKMSSSKVKTKRAANANPQWRQGHIGGFGVEGKGFYDGMHVEKCGLNKNGQFVNF